MKSYSPLPPPSNPLTIFIVTTNRIPPQEELIQVEKLFQVVEIIFKEASALSEKIEDEGIDRSTDSTGFALNFLVDEERYDVLKGIWERWKAGSNETIADIDLSGLSGLDDGDDALEDSEADNAHAVDVEFFTISTQDFVLVFEDAMTGLNYCLKRSEKISSLLHSSKNGSS